MVECTKPNDPREDPYWTVVDSDKPIECVERIPCSRDEDCQGLAFLAATCYHGNKVTKNYPKISDGHNSKNIGSCFRSCPGVRHGKVTTDEEDPDPAKVTVLSEANSTFGLGTMKATLTCKEGYVVNMTRFPKSSEVECTHTRERGSLWRIPDAQHKPAKCVRGIKRRLHSYGPTSINRRT